MTYLPKSYCPVMFTVASVLSVALCGVAWTSPGFSIVMPVTNTTIMCPLMNGPCTDDTGNVLVITTNSLLESVDTCSSSSDLTLSRISAIAGTLMCCIATFAGMAFSSGYRHVLRYAFHFTSCGTSSFLAAVCLATTSLQLQLLTSCLSNGYGSASSDDILVLFCAVMVMTTSCAGLIIFWFCRCCNTPPGRDLYRYGQSIQATQNISQASILGTPLVIAAMNGDAVVTYQSIGAHVTNQLVVTGQPVTGGVAAVSVAAADPESSSSSPTNTRVRTFGYNE